MQKSEPAVSSARRRAARIHSTSASSSMSIRSGMVHTLQHGLFLNLSDSGP